MVVVLLFQKQRITEVIQLSLQRAQHFLKIFLFFSKKATSFTTVVVGNHEVILCSNLWLEKQLI